MYEKTKATGPTAYKRDQNKFTLNRMAGFAMYVGLIDSFITVYARVQLLR
jgi:hypothetical protein